MTSMDMGTTHPSVRDAGKGHYKMTVTFSMEGPWRVSLTATGAAGTIKKSFDFQPGSKKPWTMPPEKPADKVTTTATEKPPTKADPGPTAPTVVKMPDMPSANPTVPMQSMGMAMGHDSTGMPQLKEKSVTKAVAGMDLTKNAGFGQNAPMVGMMNLMMVGGSGMEGMKMAPMDMKFDEANFAGQGSDASMADMPMGGMDVKGSLKVEAKLDKASVGDNSVSITILTSDGKPVEKAKVTTAVAMKSMDMGTAHPAVKELGKGRYVTKANFSMGGPWRLTLTVTASGMKPSTYTFDFEAK